MRTTSDRLCVTKPTALDRSSDVPDTSEAATDTIDYVATDSIGLAPALSSSKPQLPPRRPPHG
jgi:hypothetical protein